MIVDAAHVRETGNLPAAVTDALLKPHMRSASTRLKYWVGDAVYAAAETLVQAARDGLGVGETLDVDDLEARERAFIDAEAYLSLIAALPSLNMVLHDSSGITASGQAGSTNFRYLTPNELDQLINQYLRNAEEAARGYIISGDMGPTISNAYDDDGEAIT